MYNHFAIIKSFSNKSWDKINDRDKAKNFFMLNRTCAIAYPLQANHLNHLKIEPARVVDFWKFFITAKHKGVPGFIWTKTQKKAKIQSGAKYKDNVLDFIREKYQISNRELNELKEFFPEKFKTFYKDIELLIT